jgi:phage shock protein PspC (stress-responsive transcriptional regulator)
MGLVRRGRHHGDMDKLSTAETAAGLRRDPDRKMAAGVCEGAGRFFGMDPVVFRVVLAVLALTGGLGLVIYGIAWLLVPTEGDDEQQSEAHRLLSGRVEGTALTAVLVALVGCGLFLSLLGSTGNLTFSLVLLTALAGAMHWSRQRGRAAPEPPETAAPPAPRPPPPPVVMAWWKEPHPPVYLWGPDDTAHEHRKAAAHHRARRRQRRNRSWLSGMVFTLAVLAGFARMAVRWHVEPFSTSLEAGLAVALAVFSLGFLISAWLGRLGGGTVTLVVLTTALLVGAAALPKSIGADWQHEVIWRPVSATALTGSYELGAGRVGLDLSGIRPKSGQSLRTAVAVGAGQLIVTVPSNITVRINYEIGLGDTELPGDAGKDVNVRPDISGTVSYPASGSETNSASGTGANSGSGTESNSASGAGSRPGSSTESRPGPESRSGPKSRSDPRSTSARGGTITVKAEVGVGQLKVVKE